MTKQTIEPLWKGHRDAVLLGLEKMQYSSLTRTAARKVTWQEAASITRSTRIKLALSALRLGRVTSIFSLLVAAEFSWLHSKLAVNSANSLKDRGYFDLALLFFGLAAARSGTQTGTSHAIFKLGHCAKIAGNLGLAAECFAYASQFPYDPLSQSDESRADLEGALFSLTKSFTVPAQKD